MRRTTKHLACLAVALLGLTACSSQSGSGSTAGDTASSAVSSAQSSATGEDSDAPTTPDGASVGGGGELKVVTSDEPSDLAANTLKLSGALEVLGHDIFQGLVGRDPADYSLMPELALSWEQETPTTWVFHLRQGVTFQDGTPFDAAAAVVSMSYWYKADVVSVGDFVGSPAEFSARDDDTLVVTTETPDPIVPDRMTMVPVTSAKQIQDDPDSITSTAIGTGPYEVVSWNHGQDIQLKLYTDSYLAQPGMFDTIDWMFRAEPTVRANMVTTGEADIANGLSADQCAGDLKCESIPNVGLNYMRVDSFNQALLGNEDIRKAVFMAVDRKSINDAYYNGAPVMNNVVPSSGIGYSADAPTFDYNPDAAHALVEKAKAAGVDTSKTITVYGNAGYPGAADAAQVVTQEINAIGLHAVTKVISKADAKKIYYTNTDTSTLKSAMTPDRNQIWITSYGNEIVDSSAFFNLLVRCTAKDAVFCDPDVDEKIDAADSLGGEARNKAYQQLWSEVYGDKMVLLPLAQGISLWAIGGRVAGALPRPDGALPLWEMHAAS